jgi:hypothetical protein
MTIDSNQTSLDGDRPPPPRAEEAPYARRLRVRTEMRVGLATSLLVGGLNGPKKPPGDEE